MQTRNALLATLVLLAFAHPAQSSPQTVGAQWEYTDASGIETDEGTSLCLQLERASIARVPQSQRFNGTFCVSNPSDAALLLGIGGTRKDGCRYSAKGQATITLSNIQLLPEDEMYDERLEADLVAVRQNTVTLPLTDSCKGSAESASGFHDVRAAVRALASHADYRGLKDSDFANIDEATGLAELDASTQMYLPEGSTDTLVIYTENNAGTPFLTVERFDGLQWRDVSAATLPGYVNRNGSNYYLDETAGVVKVRSLPAKKAWRYSGGRFVQEG